MRNLTIQRIKSDIDMIETVNVYIEDAVRGN